MAYNELVKNFNRIRDYMREFYVYGFKSREEYKRKSARSYDDERRRVESWLGDYMGFRQTPEGKNVFLSIDSRLSRHNPLYKAWKARSFTDGDMTLHFILLDLLHDPEQGLSLGEITRRIDQDYLSGFEMPRVFDESTVRKKLKEYTEAGILHTQKQGRVVLYFRTPDPVPACSEALDYFSEVLPCGVIGSYLLEEQTSHRDLFAFKHHYITQALDSEILYQLFCAMQEHREVRIENLNRHRGQASRLRVLPLRILISVQSGRQYLAAYCPGIRRMQSYRLDYILSVCPLEPAADFAQRRVQLETMQQHMWGVSMQGASAQTEHISFTLRYGDGEAFILQRLEREKRCGTVERLDDHTCRFSADVYDAYELVPWIRTFLCRIIRLECSNQQLEHQFRSDLARMYRMYGLEDADAVS